MLNGLGRHEYYLTSAQRRLFQVIGWADWIQTFITLALMKISICLFLLRIVDTKHVVRGMYTLISCITLFTAVSVLLFLGVCRPLRAYWDVGVNGVCLSNHQVESVVLAQGSKSTFKQYSSQSNILTRGIDSPFSHFRPHTCRASGHLPSKYPAWVTN